MDSSEDSPTSSYFSDQKLRNVIDDRFRTYSARKASVLEDSAFQSTVKNSKQRQPTDVLVKQGKSNKAFQSGKRQASVSVHRGFEALTSSLSLISDALGNVIEEGLNIVEAKATNFIYAEPRSRVLRQSSDSSFSGSLLPNALKIEENLEGKPPFIEDTQLKTYPGTDPIVTELKDSSIEKMGSAKFIQASQGIEPQLPQQSVGRLGVSKDTQLKASRDVAMAMATKAKLLSRELKDVKTDLAITLQHCAQLEEENKRLKENDFKVLRHEEDDLVRLQLETLLAEKGRLAQENAAYARENKFLQEIVQYHRAKLRDLFLPEENSLMDEGSVDGSAGDANFSSLYSMDMNFLPLYPEEKDIIALEESVKITSRNQHPKD